MSNGILLTLIFFQTGHIPVFNLFESFLLVAFIIGVLGLVPLSPKDYSNKIRLWVWMEAIILLCITFFIPKEPALTLYNYDYIYIILFHICRNLALALMLYSTAYFGQFIIQRELDERIRALSHQGRNYLLLSAVMFLLGEYVGIIWCQMGWGDFWSWSQAFFQSTFIVLYLMLAFHIPGKGRFSEDIRSAVGGMTGIVVLTLTILRSLY